MAVVTMKQLLEAGVHFGHQTRRWNPKMKPFIFQERNGIYILDLQQTLKKILEAYDYIKDASAQGKKVMFVGTKKQACDTIKEEALRCGSYYINQRWLGGLLTNFATIKKRINKLRELEEMEARGDFEKMSKKEAKVLRTELQRLQKYLSGVKDMDRIPDIMFIVDLKKEYIAFLEAKKLGIVVVALVDTNCDPTGVDYPIPGNDDAIRAVRLLTRAISEGVIAGQSAGDFSEADFQGGEGAVEEPAQAETVNESLDLQEQEVFQAPAAE